MLDIFDRLGNLIRSMLDEEGDDRIRKVNPRFADPDLGAAWDELNDYLNEDDDHDQKPPSNENPFGHTASRQAPDTLRTDFRNLEVGFGAPMDEVRSAYKRLMATYHPDRHTSDPDRLRTATEIAKKINQSYQRIRNHYAEG